MMRLNSDIASHYDVLDTTYHIKALNTPFASHDKVKAVPSDLYVTASTAQHFANQHGTSQEFMKRVYETVHNAKLNYFMPLLFSGVNNSIDEQYYHSDDDLIDNLSSHNGIDDHYNDCHFTLPVMLKRAAKVTPNVAIGLKPLYTEKVFLEQYLAAPIEEVIGELQGYSVQRARICEIGNLASQSAGNARLMIAFLVFYLSTPTLNSTLQSQTTKADWAVCTGTTAVQHILNSMGIRSHIVAKATVDALADPTQVSAWGRYYENNPLVLAINVADARAVCSPYYEYTEHTRGNMNPIIQTTQVIQVSQQAFIETPSTQSVHNESVPPTRSDLLYG